MTFMDVHHGMTRITADQLKAAHAADEAIEGEEGVHFEQAWADPESGTAYCLSEAPSKEAVQRDRAGFGAGFFDWGSSSGDLRVGFRVWRVRRSA
ncbi:nickel-binding protein [Kitasatospora sp. NPDC053057]|uniref:nickel-binding protein n=1 Tax=Kitasatospora sp. NPDC053057 TaxID=3364062 RepID=UPI0037C81C26